MIYLSIIIPSYNSELTIITLLNSILKSGKVKLADVELIIVDDKSNDTSVRLVVGYFKKNPKFGKTKIIQLHKNSGPAYARNIGVKYAKGKVVLFLDSDVVVYKNTIYEVIRSFKNDADLYALTGVWDKEQRNNKFFPKFKALRDWSYWINERDPRHYYYLFSTRVAAIDRALFNRLGGFNESYKAALVEDIELTYRIARRYAVVFNPSVIVHHEFENFGPVAKKYFWRSFYWSRIYRERKKFDPVATTGKEAITTLSAGLLLIMLILYLVSGIMSRLSGIPQAAGNYDAYYTFRFLILTSFFLLLFIHLWGVRKFLMFAVREEGLLFAVKSFFTGIILYWVILAGAVFSFI